MELKAHCDVPKGAQVCHCPLERPYTFLRTVYAKFLYASDVFHD